MKIIAKLTLYNAVMLERRRELSLTQQDLANMLCVKQGVISRIELLRKPYGANQPIDLLLHDIAEILDVDFNKIFPQEYLDAVYNNTLFSEPYLAEVNTDMLRLNSGISTQLYLLPSELEEKVDQELLRITIDDLLDVLGNTEKRVLELRYGLHGEKEHTLEQTAIKLMKESNRSLTSTRISQIEHKALSKIRNPARSTVLRKMWRGDTQSEH